MKLSLTEYRRDPCRISSLPYWKSVRTAVPDHMKIVHDTEYDAEKFRAYADEWYFRLYHDLRNIARPKLPEGYALVHADAASFAAHINACYPGCALSAEELARYQEHPVYSADLWIAVADRKTGAIVASGIAEMDRNVREGALEWIQVSPAYRRKGLGSFMVKELLWRMRQYVDFATVSGKADDPGNPEALYRSCGFTGQDIWHILTRK